METPLQLNMFEVDAKNKTVTILILVETPLQPLMISLTTLSFLVTILILVETPLQHMNQSKNVFVENCHNPYFSGNSFATQKSSVAHEKEQKSQSLF